MVFPYLLRRLFLPPLFALIFASPSNTASQCPGGRPPNPDGSCGGASTGVPERRVTQNAVVARAFELMGASSVRLKVSSHRSGDVQRESMLNELQGNIAFLQGALTGSDKPVPNEYFSSLILDVVALGRLADQGGAGHDMFYLKFASELKIENEAAAFSILRDVADDVAIKTAQ